jgi:hypothetical protein
MRMTEEMLCAMVESITGGLEFEYLGGDDDAPKLMKVSSLLFVWLFID